MRLSIALDAMSGDHGPSAVIPAALDTLKKHDDLQLILVGHEDVLRQTLRDHGASEDERLIVHHASQRVQMNDLPSQALRSKKDSSMRVAIDLVRDRVAHACVSAGNTGALMATARFVLKTLPGIDRPAICTTMPAINGHTHLLDLGANVDSTAEQLFQFAVMGSALTSAVDNIPDPKVALLNIGQEEIKGSDRVKEAAALLAESDLNYVGFVEGTDIFKGKVDVIVCDGFVGNVAIKASEGVAEMIAHYAKEEFQRSLYSRLAALLSNRVINALRQKTDPRRYNGASFLGLRGIVIKSHGGADTVSFAHAIEEAIIEIQKNVPERISSHLESLLTERQAI
ncbi:MAG: phosphate acyltransferase PlsX [Gammaproteobacteria bacterium]|nr:phosphate acyltransferase PlsX [Gammaproteobacteria bacterium]MCI0590324.1 phosphate acyltransferase PlsX [Gammaproteobacteria bacterium]